MENKELEKALDAFKWWPYATVKKTQRIRELFAQAHGVCTHGKVISVMPLAEIVLGGEDND